jgi:glucosylceramidase
LALAGYVAAAPIATRSRARLIAGVLIAALLLGGLMSAGAAHAATEPVNVWLTTGDRSRLLEAQPSLQFGADRRDGLVVDVNEQHRYQEMDGFGAAMTDSSAWLIENSLTGAQRDQLIRRLFSASEGIGMSYVRVPIGSSDHALSHYTYDDTC